MAEIPEKIWTMPTLWLNFPQHWQLRKNSFITLRLDVNVRKLI
jgi:hypothetical protein